MRLRIRAPGKKAACEALVGSEVGLLSARTPRVTSGEMLPPTLPTVPTVPVTVPTAVPTTAPATVPTTAPTTVPATVCTTAAPLSLSSTPGSLCNTCPENWVNFQQKCYYFGEGAKKWIQARLACSKLQGRLVSIHSQEEQVGLGSAEGAASTAGRGPVEPHLNLLASRGTQAQLPSHPALSCSPGLPGQVHQHEGLLDWPSGPGQRRGVCLDG